MNITETKGKLLDVALDIIYNLLGSIFSPLSKSVPLDSIKPVDSLDDFVIPNVFHSLLQVQTSLIFNCFQRMNLDFSMVVNGALSRPEFARDKGRVLAKFQGSKVSNRRCSQNT